MSPWTSMLESLHSAWIDELTDLCDDPKPELGLPQRSAWWRSPAEGVTKILTAQVDVDEERGLAALAFEPLFEKALGKGAEAFWESLLARAGTEFSRRSIYPHWGSARQLVGPDFPLPPGFPSPRRVIWIPVRVRGSACYLGVGA